MRLANEFDMYVSGIILQGKLNEMHLLKLEKWYEQIKYSKKINSDKVTLSGEGCRSSE